jgi:hypothetical protein
MADDFLEQLKRRRKKKRKQEEEAERDITPIRGKVRPKKY